MSYKDQAIADVICAEFSLMTREEIESMTFAGTYGSEHYDYDKIYCEGSTWVVYWYDVMKDYYSKNKERIDQEALHLLI